MAAERLARWTGHQGPVYALSNDDAAGTTFLSGSGDGLVVRWSAADPPDGIPVARIGRAIFSLRRQGSLLWVGDEDGGVHSIDLQHAQELFFSHTHRKGVFRFQPLADGRMAAAGGDGRLSLWAAGGSIGEPLRTIPVSAGKLRDLALDPLTGDLVVASADGMVRWLRGVDLNEVRTIEAHPSGVASIAFLPGKEALLSGGKDGHLRVWVPARDTPLVDLKVHTGAIYGVIPGADGAWFATIGRDRTVKFWDAHTLEPMARVERGSSGHTHSVNAGLAIGDRLITAGDDRALMAWKP